MTKLPKNKEIVSAVSSMHCKHSLTSNQITKYKAKLNIYGDNQTCLVNYFQAYPLVAQLFSIRLLVIFRTLFIWALKEVDVVMAYIQAPINMDIYMKLPTCLDMEHSNSNSQVLQLLIFVFRSKQVDCVQLKVDECISFC